MSDPQEKLNEIDAMLYKYGIRQPDTLKKVKELMIQHKEYKDGLESADRISSQAQHLLEFGYVEA